MPNHRILVIEDDPTVQAIMGVALEDAGYQVLVSDSTVDPDDVPLMRLSAVILDLWLDGRDSGWDYLRALKQSPETRAIPVVVCTGDRSLVSREESQLAELATGVLVKPFSLEALSAQVAACVLPGGVAGSGQLHQVW